MPDDFFDVSATADRLSAEALVVDLGGYEDLWTCCWRWGAPRR